MALTRSMGARPDVTRGTAAVEVRKGIAGQYIRPGVLPGGATPLVTGTSGMAYSVGVAAFVTSRGAADGYHLFTNDGAVTIGTTGVGSTVPAAPGTGLKRIDIIWVFHPSADENEDSTSQPVFGVSSGDAHSLPQPPSIPTGALELARNEVSAGVTSTAASGNAITQTAPYTAVRGAPVLVRSEGERNALASLASAANPIVADLLDTGRRERHAGSGWVQDAGQTRTRDVPVTVAGTLGTTVDVAAPQAIPGSPFGAIGYALRITAQVAALVPSGLGVQIQALFNDTVVATDIFTNAGGSPCSASVSIDRTLEIWDASPHTVRVTATPLAGNVTILGNDAGKLLNFWGLQVYLRRDL